MEALLIESHQNLESWRFEPRTHEERVHIRYSFVIDPTLEIPQGYLKFDRIQFDLPNQVTVLGRSLSSGIN